MQRIFRHRYRALVHTTRARDGHRGWHEAKVGVCARFEPTPVATAPEEPGKRKPVYQSVDYCVGFEPQADFLPRMYAHALQAGLKDSSCRQIVLIADEATGFGNRARPAYGWLGRPGWKFSIFITPANTFGRWPRRCGPRTRPPKPHGPRPSSIACGMKGAGCSRRCGMPCRR